MTRAEDKRIPPAQSCVVRPMLEKWSASQPDKVFVKVSASEEVTYRRMRDLAASAAAGEGRLAGLAEAVAEVGRDVALLVQGVDLDPGIGEDPLVIGPDQGRDRQVGLACRGAIRGSRHGQEGY